MSIDMRVWKKKCSLFRLHLREPRSAVPYHLGIHLGIIWGCVGTSVSPLGFKFWSPGTFTVLLGYFIFRPQYGPGCGIWFLLFGPVWNLVSSFYGVLIRSLCHVVPWRIQDVVCRAADDAYRMWYVVRSWRIQDVVWRAALGPMTLSVSSLWGPSYVSCLYTFLFI